MGKRKFRRGGNRFTGLSKGRIAKRGVRNQTESEYEELLIVDPQVVAYWFEPFTLRLSHPDTGQPAKYTPDFLVLLADGTTYVDDVKGTGPDDPGAIVRVKTAAELFPLWVFRVAKKQTKRNGGGFKVVEV